ncbi:unnamed protein product, partial [Brassicogethes aeneus]
AHCVPKKKDNDIAVSPEDFTVSAGKSYLDKVETSVQSSKITGRGITKPDQVKIPNELQEIPIPIVDESVCKNKLPAPFLKYYSEDKFCAGYYNQTKGVCQGFVGGGFYFEKDGRHYIKGILSVSPVINGKCDLQQYGLYIRSFIDQEIIEDS